MVSKLVCSTCGWEDLQEHDDSGGKVLEILKGMHEMTFKDHQCGIEGGNPQKNEL